MKREGKAQRASDNNLAIKGLVNRIHLWLISRINGWIPAFFPSLANGRRWSFCDVWSVLRLLQL